MLQIVTTGAHEPTGGSEHQQNLLFGSWHRLAVLHIFCPTGLKVQNHTHQEIIWGPPCNLSTEIAQKGRSQRLQEEDRTLPLSSLTNWRVVKEKGTEMFKPLPAATNGK